MPSCRFCAALPEPQKSDTPGSPLHGLRPCLAIVPVDNAPEGPARPQPAAEAGVEPACELESAGPSGVVQVYTLRTHSVVQTLHFSSRVLSVRASCRLLSVALDAQVRPCSPAVDTLLGTPNMSIALIGAPLFMTRHGKCCPSQVDLSLDKDTQTGGVLLGTGDGV